MAYDAKRFSQFGTGLVLFHQMEYSKIAAKNKMKPT
jgi:hypothetical protein